MLLLDTPVSDLRSALRRQRADDLFVYLAVLFVALIVAALAIRSGHVPFPVAAGIYVLGIPIILWRPVVGVYGLIFFSLVGDPSVSSWWPFTKGASSRESILFVADAIIVSPMEGYIAVTVIAMVLHIARGRLELTHRPELIRPLIVFTAAVLLGVIYGLGTGGSSFVAVHESRAILALPVLTILAVNLFTERRHLNTALWVIVAAVFVDSILSLDWYFRQIDAAERAGTDSLNIHSASVHANVALVTFASAWLTRRASFAKRLVLPFMLVPIFWVYGLSERRSAIGALVVAAILMSIVLYHRDRARFYAVIPLATFIMLGYTAAFWNVESGIGFPAQAIKGQVIGTEGLDEASNAYRAVENINILVTLRTNPLLGIGFGKPYLQAIPLPDLGNAFVLWRYVTHNSMLYIWMKTGIVGFVSLLYVLGRGVAVGVRAAIRAKDPESAVLATVGATFIAMFFAFAYVDIAWEPESMVVLATAFAMVVRTDKITAPESEDTEA